MKIEKKRIFPRGDKLESRAEKEGQPTLEAYIRVAKARSRDTILFILRVFCT